MRVYETTFIINPQTDDENIERHVKEISDLITKNQGQIVHEEKMGTRRLAYPIQGLNQGFYASFIFEASEKVLPLLDRYYKLNEAYIRNLTVRFEGNPKDLMEPQNPFVKTNVYKDPSRKKPADTALDKEKQKQPEEEKVVPAVSSDIPETETQPNPAETEKTPDPADTEIKTEIEKKEDVSSPETTPDDEQIL